VPIRRFLGSASFGPDDLKAMGIAFSDALRKLGLTDQQDPRADLVARKIVRAALDGERDPVKLCERAIGAFDDGTPRAG
jgi:hypothetical protein